MNRKLLKVSLDSANMERLAIRRRAPPQNELNFSIEVRMLLNDTFLCPL